MNGKDSWDPPTGGGAAVRDWARYRFWGQSCGLEDLVVVGFDGVETLDRPYRFTIELERANDELNPERLLGLPATLAISRSENEREIHGIVSRFEHRALSGLHNRMVIGVELVPAVVASQYTVTTRIFQGVTAIDIVEEVLGEDLARYQRSLDAGGLDRSAYEVRDYCVQYRESNLDFVHRLCGRRSRPRAARLARANPDAPALGPTRGGSSGSQEQPQVGSHSAAAQRGGSQVATPHLGPRSVVGARISTRQPRSGTQ